jgi:hypothetical protein
VKVRVECERCKGSGYEKPPPGQSALGGRPGLSCRACDGSGSSEGSWMSMAEFREQYIDGK